ncbi:MAG TPA: hypothetical protein VFZ32_19590 [Micromonosporaceae bacterium]
MAVRSGARWWAGGLVVLGLALVALGWFLAGQGLENANRWAGVIGVFPALTGLLVAVYSVIRDRRAASPDGEQRAASGTVRNEVVNAQVTGPAVLGRDMQRISLPGVPAPAVADHTASEGPAGATPQGDTENHVRGGTFHGPLIMGRDLRDVVLPPSSPSPPPLPERDGDGAGR